MDCVPVISQSHRKRLWSSRRDMISSMISPELYLQLQPSSEASPSKAVDLFIDLLVNRVISKDDHCLALLYQNFPERGCFCKPLLGSPTLGLLPDFTISDHLAWQRSEIHNQKTKIQQKTTIDVVSSNPVAGERTNSNGVSQLRRHLNTEHIPVEIFELIIRLLSRHDVKQMRLVNHDWERKVAGSLFRSIVVPFSTEIYGTLGKKSTRSTGIGPNCTDKQGAVTQDETQYFTCYDLTVGGQRLLKEIDMFGGFGPHIRHFGISFEVDEDVLSKPLLKSSQSGHDSYWGGYVWPSKDYQRFADRAGLEITADETGTMTKAFAKLSDVTQLALSINSGLGYIQGPDISLRGRILAETPDVFGSSCFDIDPKTHSKRQLWQYLEKIYQRAGFAQNFKCAEITRVGAFKNEHVIQQLINATSSKSWYQVEPELVMNSPEESLSQTTTDSLSSLDQTSTVPHVGILLIKVSVKNDKKFDFARSINPAEMSNSQQEWLLETVWAQDAFLSSYMLSIADNAPVFQKVERLNISRMSSRHLDKLCRQDFWDSLPRLSALEIKIIADWRDVEKDETGAANTPIIAPSGAAKCFRKLISRHLTFRKSIKTLSIGWVDGGEHAEGIKSRNKNLLPAILTSKSYLTRIDDGNHEDMLVLPFVEHFKLINCWVTPNALRAFLIHHNQLNMATVTLDSVSLTTHPRFQRPGGALAGLLAFANLIVALPQHLHHMTPVQLGNAAHYAGLPLPQGGAVGGPPMGQAGAEILAASALQYPSTGAAGTAAMYNHAFPNPAGLYTALLNHLIILGQGQGLVAGINNAGSSNPQNDLDREGSWPDLLSSLDTILRGHHSSLNSSSYKNNNDDLASYTEHSVPRVKNLTLHLHSAGYARLRSCNFDQTALERAELSVQRSEQTYAGNTVSNYFESRMEVLENSTMRTSDEWLGRIVCALPIGEMDAMIKRWGPGSIREGWPSVTDTTVDEDIPWSRWGEATADASLFDGEPRGGTGRFSGTLVLGDSESR